MLKTDKFTLEGKGETDLCVNCGSVGNKFVVKRMDKTLIRESYVRPTHRESLVVCCRNSSRPTSLSSTCATCLCDQINQ